MRSWFSAAGLYYLAELVEEYSTIAKKIIWWMNAVCYTHNLGAECSAGVLQVVTSLYVFLWLFESFPLTMILCGVLGQLCHFVILSNFPFVAFSSIQFIFGVILVIVNHYLAFSYFSSTYHPFSEVCYTSELQTDQCINQ